MRPGTCFGCLYLNLERENGGDDLWRCSVYEKGVTIDHPACDTWLLNPEHYDDIDDIDERAPYIPEVTLKEAKAIGRLALARMHIDNLVSVLGGSEVTWSEE